MNASSSVSSGEVGDGGRNARKHDFVVAAQLMEARDKRLCQIQANLIMIRAKTEFS
jgi:hypothetical protein